MSPVKTRRPRRRLRGRPKGQKRDLKVLFSVMLERQQREIIGEMSKNSGEALGVILRRLIDKGLESEAVEASEKPSKARSQH